MGLAVLRRACPLRILSWGEAGCWIRPRTCQGTTWSWCGSCECSQVTRALCVPPRKGGQGDTPISRAAPAAAPGAQGLPGDGFPCFRGAMSRRELSGELFVRRLDGTARKLQVLLSSEERFCWVRAVSECCGLGIASAEPGGGQGHQGPGCDCLRPPGRCSSGVRSRVHPPAVAPARGGAVGGPVPAAVP